MSDPATGRKDLFSRQATDYAKFRPTYPDALYDYLATLVPSRVAAWDCGTGNGQAAVRLAERFERVFATDPSPKQLANAQPRPNIAYSQAAAESSGLPAASVDLVTVAQAIHWFKLDEFFAEARRVLKPGGIIAFWTYELAQIEPEVDKVVLYLYRDILGPYWDSARKLVEEGYRTIKLPFDEIQPPRFEMRARWSVEHLLGYLGTWSVLQSYIDRNGTNPLNEMEKEIRAAWGAAAERDVRWELGLRVGRKG